MSTAVRIRTAAALATLLYAGGGAAPLSAHDVWLEPSAFRVAPGEVVTVGLREGHGVEHPRPVPRDGRRIERFVITGGRGESPVLGLDGEDPAGVLRLEEPGLHVVAYRGRPLTLSLPAAKFDRYLREKGLDEARRLRAERGEQEAAARERYSRALKCLLWVEGAAGETPAEDPGATNPAVFDADRPLGLTFELVAETNPYRLAPGQPLGVRVLYRGEPVEGAQVEAVRLAGGEPRIVRSGADGRVQLRLTGTGPWLLTAVHLVPARAPGADWESVWSSLTFELGGAAEGTLHPRGGRNGGGERRAGAGPAEP